MKLFNKVAIVGVGLIGGSLGLALRKKGLVGEIIGFSRHEESLRLAKRRRIIDEGYRDIRKVILDKDLVILATPVNKIIEIIPQIFPFLKRGAIVTDVGSTKSEIVKQAEKYLTGEVYFVGAHPLAGSEKKGVKEAKENIFENAFCIVTPTKNTDKFSLRKIIRLWESLGTKVKIMNPDEHDALVAKISHLPHAIAVALILALDKKLIPLGAGGLKDTTRIALSDPKLWQDIFLTNQKKIIGALAEFSLTLKKITTSLKNRDKDRLYYFLKRAKEKRSLLKG